MTISRSGTRPSQKGQADWFTGDVRIEPLFQGADTAHVVGAAVTFQPGARTHWHTHPLGQALIVTTGHGWHQCWGEPVEDMRPGDIVTCGPGVKHWHGATQTSVMTHIGIQESLDGKVVEWMEEVTDAQYRGPKDK